MKNKFTINKKEINFVQTLSCGQIFSYKETGNGFVVYSKNKVAEIIERQNDYEILTDDIDYFKNFFDLKTDYEEIKNKLKKFKVLEKPIQFGEGIRILKQNLFEVIISFVVSANNNIPRIKNSLFYFRENFGTNFAFPTLKQLLQLTENDFKKAGLGYRAIQLIKLLKQLKIVNYDAWKTLPTEKIKQNLIELSGIGPKVADCILLFGYSRTDVFPVDTWIEKSYNEHFKSCKNRLEIRKRLLETFGNLSGYAQQYLFYYQREK